MKILNSQQLVNDLQDLQRLANKLANTFVVSVATSDIEPNDIDRLTQGVAEVQQITKSIQIGIQP